MQKLRLIIDLATNRVVYFTSDLTEYLTVDEHTALALFEGNIPSEMSVSNCFNFTFTNKELKNTATKSAPIPILEQNRKSIKAMINEKIEEKFNTKIQAPKFNIEFKRALLEETKIEDSELLEQYRLINNFESRTSMIELIQKEDIDHKKWVLTLGIKRINWLNRADSSTTSEELFAIRDEVFEDLKNL